MSPYTTSSKSKTFPKESNFGDLMGFVTDNIETDDHQLLFPFLVVPGRDVKIETCHKYIITITKIEEKL